MEDIKWERLHPATKAVRTGFDSLFAELNGVQLYVTLSYYQEGFVENKEAFELRWSVSKSNQDGLSVLSGSAYQVFAADVTDQELRKVFYLFQRRAQAIAEAWVEE